MMSCTFSAKTAAVFLLALMLTPSVIVAATFTEAAYGLDGATAALTEWTIPTANSLPTGLALDSSGNCCWFVESSGNKVAHFDPLNDAFGEWSIPTTGSNPAGLALTMISGSLAVFGTESAKSKVFLFIPSTGIFKEYTLPTSHSTPLNISIEPGTTEIRAWFTEPRLPPYFAGEYAVGEIIYNPQSGIPKLFELTFPPAAGGGPNSVRAGAGIVWFAGGNAIVQWDQSASQFTTWTVPSHPSTQVASVDVDALGQVWYASSGLATTSTYDYAGVLRSDNSFTEWQVPTLSAAARVISVSPVTQNPWIAEESGNEIAVLDPSVGGVVTSSRPSVTRFLPAIGALATSVAGPILPSTVTVTPVATTIESSTAGQFTEWMLAAGSGPRGLVVDASGNAWVLESSANKIARLSLTTDFAIGCDPSSFVVTQDANTTTACTVTSVDGFTSAVELTGSWVGVEPKGVAYTLTTPITPSPGRAISSTLIISTGPTASTGTFTFQVNGTSGALTHNVNLDVTISAGVADFTITVSPSYLSVVQGGTATSTIAVQSLGVFFSPVDLTMSGAPNGMTLLIGGNPVTPPIRETSSSTLTVTVSGPSEGPTPEGTYPIMITGTSGSLTRNATLTVQVTTSGCLIATATYGSELSDEVQFLRNFRDNSILKTNAGSNFMIVFNAWYYSFSPGVAQFIREHPPVRTAMKFVLYPLIGILRIGAATFNAFPTNMEAGAVLSGIITSSLIGLVYLAIPFTALLAYSSRASRIAKKLQAAVVAVLVSALASLAFASAFGAPAPVMMIATSAIVLASLAASALLASRAILRMTKPS